MGLRCPICDHLPNAGNHEVTRVESADGYQYECARCGTYGIERQFVLAIAGTHLSAAERVALSGIIRQRTDHHPKRRMLERIGVENYQEIIKQNPVPKGPLDQIDHLMLEIDRLTQFVGRATPDESSDAWAARAFLPSPTELWMLASELAALHWLTVRRQDHLTSFLLKFEGLKRVQELRSNRGPGNQAFVAMWFHPQMDPAYDHGIRPALESSGYLPYRVKDAHHNNKIDDEIITQIRRSRLVVVDVTGARLSVYFEAGFAMGLETRVLWCCNEVYKSVVQTEFHPESTTNPKCELKRWDELLAFDAAHYNFIMWSDPEQLRKKLEDRIEGLGWRLPTATNAT